MRQHPDSQYYHQFSQSMINYKIMNFKPILTGCALLLCCLIFQTGYAQNTPVTINPRTLKVKAVMEQLEKKAGLNFIYSGLSAELDKTISLSPSANSVSEILTELSKKSGLAFANHLFKQLQKI